MPYLFILDGYDEVSFEGKFCDLIELDQWPQSKAIVTCRAHFLQGSYAKQFVKEGPLPEAYFASLNPEEVRQYSEGALKKVQQEGKAKEEEPSEVLSNFHQILQSIPQLAELAMTPYLAHQLVAIQSRLTEAFNSYYRLSRAKIYGLFTRHRFEQELERLHRSGIDMGPKGMDSFVNCSQELAFEMLKRGVSSLRSKVVPGIAFSAV